VYLLSNGVTGLIEKGWARRAELRALPYTSGSCRLARRNVDPMAAILEVEGLTKAFDGLVAVNGMSLAVSLGEILGLIGPNGSGKTMLRHLIAGAIRPDTGTIRMTGEDVTRLSNHQRVRKEINRTFQLVRAPPNMPAIATVMAGVLYGCGRRVSMKEAAYEAAGFLGEMNLITRRTGASTSSPTSSRSVESWQGRWQRDRVCCCSTNGCQV
jgi:ABC-type sugar transport system ATPase subunit